MNNDAITKILRNFASDNSNVEEFYEDMISQTQTCRYVSQSNSIGY